MLVLVKTFDLEMYSLFVVVLGAVGTPAIWLPPLREGVPPGVWAGGVRDSRVGAMAIPSRACSDVHKCADVISSPLLRQAMPHRFSSHPRCREAVAAPGASFRTNEAMPFVEILLYGSLPPASVGRLVGSCHLA